MMVTRRFNRPEAMNIVMSLVLVACWSSLAASFTPPCFPCSAERARFDALDGQLRDLNASKPVEPARYIPPSRDGPVNKPQPLPEQLYRQQLEEYRTALNDWRTKLGSWHVRNDPGYNRLKQELASVDCATRDGDGLDDDCEQALAERFAPIVYHSADETNFPANVDWFLPKTVLCFYDDDCTPDLVEQLVWAPTQTQLLSQSYGGGCGATSTEHSNGTRSEEKQRTFYLRDVAEEYRLGCSDSRGWTTYFHAYRNDLGGATIQYWRFYAFNDAINNHGGDWEGIHIVLDAGLQVVKVGLLGHASIDYRMPSAFQWEGTHLRVFSEGGGHATRENGASIKSRGCSTFPCVIDPNDPHTFIRQESWTVPSLGQVKWPDGRVTSTGPLTNVGEKTSPLSGQVFIQYSGLWGSPGLMYGTGGYWGPAYNETGKTGSFIMAWCAGIVGVDATECQAAAASR